MKKIIIISIFLFIVAMPVLAVSEEKYKVPDVKEDYCGVEIPFQNCKCAFHNKYCDDAIKKDSWQSRIYVMNKFNSWVEGLIYDFGKRCILQGGSWNKPSLTCTYLDEKEKLDDRTIVEKYNLPKLDFKPIPKVSTVRGKVLNADGEVFVWSASFRKWRGPVKSGTLIYNGDVLITTNRGEAKLIMYGPGGQDTVDVRTDTFLEIPDPTNFKEYNQSLWGILKNKALEVYNAVTNKEVKVPMWRRQMQTVTVTLSTRGTHYIVAYDEISNTSSVFLNEGEAEITPISGGDTVILSDGESYIYSGDGVVATSTMSAKEWENIRAQYGFKNDKFYVYEEDLIVPNGASIDIEVDKLNKDDIVPNRNFFEEQIGSKKAFSWWIVIVAIFVAAGGYYWKFKKKS